MSYDLYLRNKDGVTEIMPDGHDLRGGTYCMGGTDEAWLNVTYNYGPHFYRTFGEKGIRTLYGMTGAASVPLIDSAISQLGDDVDADYWKATEGNAKMALNNLRLLALACPDAVWEGD